MARIPYVIKDLREDIYGGRQIERLDTNTERFEGRHIIPQLTHHRLGGR